jgi:hypothetical protein
VSDLSEELESEIGSMRTWYSATSAARYASSTFVDVQSERAIFFTNVPHTLPQMLIEQ